jgi:transposase
LWGSIGNGSIFIRNRYKIDKLVYSRWEARAARKKTELAVAADAVVAVEVEVTPSYPSRKYLSLDLGHKIGSLFPEIPQDL